MAQSEQPDMTSLLVQLLSAYVSNNMVASEDLPALIQATRIALSGEAAPVETAAPEYIPAVTVRKSLGSRDHIISLIDGKPYRTLKRHLATNGLTPDEYRERYGLAKSYPMIAPGYSEQRREVAQRLGLGRKPGSAKAAPSEVAETTIAAAEAPAPAPPKAAATPPKAPRKRVLAKTATVVPAMTATGEPVETPAPVSEAAVTPAKGKPKAKAAIKTRKEATAPAPAVTAIGAVPVPQTEVAEPTAPVSSSPPKPTGTKTAAKAKAVTAKSRKSAQTETAKSTAAPKKRGPAKAKGETVSETSDS